MPTVRFPTLYRKSGTVSAWRIAMAEVRIPEASETLRPVATLTRDGQDHTYFACAGDLWEPLAGATPGHRLDLASLNSQIDRYADAMAKEGWHPLQTDIRAYQKAISQGATAPRDSEDMSPEFLASPEWQDIRDRAAEMVEQDGALFRKSPGPLIRLVGQPLSTLTLHGQHGLDSAVSNARVRTFRFDETDLAMRTCEAVFGRSCADHASGTITVHDEIPYRRVDLEPQALESMLWHFLAESRALPVHAMDRSVIETVMDARHLLESRTGRPIEHGLPASSMSPRRMDALDLGGSDGLAEMLRRADAVAATLPGWQWQRHDNAIALARHDLARDLRPETDDGMALESAFG